MAILSWTWMKIKVEIADKSTAFSLIVPYTKDLNILVPNDILTLASCCKVLA